MGVIGFENGAVWGASGAAVEMLIRFAIPHAVGIQARKQLDKVERVGGGVGLHLDLISDTAVRADVEQALRRGASDMRLHLERLSDLLDAFDMAIGNAGGTPG